MEKAKYVIRTESETGTIAVREGTLPDLLPILPPVKINIIGTIDAPVEFLRKRHGDTEQIDVLRTHITVNRHQMSITLVTRENDGYLKGEIQGILSQHPKFAEFGINNQAVNWEPNELGQFFKMNRAFFPDKAVNMKLVNDLRNFDATINSKIEKQKSEKGDFKDNYSGTVMSNLPEAFTLDIPIFKGGEKETIEVEFYASVNGREVGLQLVSPAATQLTEEVRDTIMNEKLAEIREIEPGIVIIEQ